MNRQIAEVVGSTGQMPGLAALAIAFGVLLSGCAIPAGGKAFPGASTGFHPKVTYDSNLDDCWKAVVSALNAHRIIIVVSSRGGGQIITDYATGPYRLEGFGVLGTSTNRYKFRISLAQQEDKRTTINITPTLESIFLSGEFTHSDTASYRNLSAENPKLVAQLRDWMYEQIEKNL